MNKKIIFKLLILVLALSLFTVSCADKNPASPSNGGSDNTEQPDGSNPGGDGGSNPGGDGGSNPGGDGGSNPGGDGGSNPDGDGGSNPGEDQIKYGIDSAYYGQWNIYYDNTTYSAEYATFSIDVVPLFDNKFNNSVDVIDVSKYDEYGSGYTFYKLENSSTTVLLYFKDNNTGYAIQYNSAGEAVKYAAILKSQPPSDRLDSSTFSSDWYKYTDKYCNMNVDSQGHLTIVAPDSSMWGQGDKTYHINAYGITRKTGSSFLDPNVYYDITSFPYKGSIENAAEENEEEFKSINLILSSHDDLFEMKKSGSDITINKATSSKYINESGLKKTKY